MVILIKNGRVIFSRDPPLKATSYETMMTRTVLDIWKTKTVKRDMNIKRIVHISNTPGENDGCIQNPELSPWVYKTSIMDSQCHTSPKIGENNMR